LIFGWLMFATATLRISQILSMDTRDHKFHAENVHHELIGYRARTETASE